MQQLFTAAVVFQVAWTDKEQIIISPRAENILTRDKMFFTSDVVRAQRPQGDPDRVSFAFTSVFHDSVRNSCR